MPDRHKSPTLRYRPPEAERLWLLAYQEHTGRSVNGILTEAVRMLKSQISQDWNGSEFPADEPAD